MFLSLINLSLFVYSIANFVCSTATVELEWDLRITIKLLKSLFSKSLSFLGNNNGVNSTKFDSYFYNLTTLLFFFSNPLI